MSDASPHNPSAVAHPHRLPTDTDSGLLLIISGPSGVGKTTITRAVERAIPGSVFSVSATTRAKTAADVEGVDYHFVDEAEFQRMVDADEFLEYAGVFDKRYGTPRAWVLEQLRRGRLVILEIDVQGAKIVKSKVPDAFSIFIEPPSEDELLRRLRLRKREDEAKIQRRFAAAKAEIHTAHASKIYNRFITNNILDAAIAEAIDAVTTEMAKRNA
jgi:guanylate kinase